MVRVTVAEPPGASVTLVTLRVTAGPLGETVVVSVMVPEKLPMLVRVIVDVAHEPATIVRDDGTGEMVKSWPGTITVMVTE
jgi:hypothetical protein